MKKSILAVLVGLCMFCLASCGTPTPKKEDIIKNYVLENMDYDLEELHVVQEGDGYHITMLLIGEASSLQGVCKDAVTITSTCSQETGIAISTVNPSVKNAEGDFYGWRSDGLLYSDSATLEANADLSDISYYLFLHGIIDFDDANLTEEKLEQSFLDDLEQALVDGQNSDSEVSIDSSDEFVRHYQKMISAVYDCISKYEGVSFQNEEFEKNFNLFYLAVKDGMNLLNSSSYNTRDFLSSWYEYYWNMCCAVKFFYTNYNLQLEGSTEDMLRIADLSLASTDDIMPYHGGWTTYEYHFADTNPNVVVDGYEYNSLFYDFVNKDAVTSMHTFYLFGCDSDGSIIMVNGFMRPCKTIDIVEEGHFIEDDRDYYLIEEYSGSVDPSIVKKEPEIGMTENEVLASTWGWPNKKNTTETAYAVHEQWVYNDRGYIYFENGIVTTIQKR